MKKNWFLSMAVALTLVGCKTAQLTSYTDDVYVSPGELKLLAQKAEAEKARLAAIEKKKADSLLALAKEKEREKINSNPYYKDPVFNSDDYYDYQYASRINRFSNPVMASYYDPYYTNIYTYNPVPGLYGTSIYSTYNCFNTFPSSQFGFYSNYQPFGYAPYNYNPYFGSSWNNNVNYSCWNGCNHIWGCNSNYYCGNGYNYNSVYWNNYGYCNSGWNNGCNSGWNNNGWNGGQWGYFNSQDPNSGYSRINTGPRGQSSSDGRTNRAEAPGQTMFNNDAEGNARGQNPMAGNEQNAGSRFISSRSRRNVENNETSGSANSQTGRYIQSQPETPVQTNTGNNQNNAINTDRNSIENKVNTRRNQTQSSDNKSSSNRWWNTMGTTITQSQSDDWNNRRQNNEAGRSSGQTINSGNSSQNSNSGSNSNNGGNSGGGSERRGSGGGSGRPR